MSNEPEFADLVDVKPRLTVVGVGGAGCNAVNNMIAAGLQGVEFVVANTDAQSLAASSAEHRIQLGTNLTEGLGAGSRPEIGEAAAEEAVEEIREHLVGSHMVFVAAGMGGGTGTGAAAVIARTARECGALTVGIVCKPFQFEGARRMRMAEAGVQALRPHVDTLIVIPNQNLFRIANPRTTFAEAFVLADQILYSGVACIVELVLKEGLINLDFADVRTVMSGMGTAMMGTGEATGEDRATLAAEEAIANPLLDDISLQGAKGLLLSITGGRDLTLFEVDEAASRIREEVDPEANIIVGATFDDNMGDRIRVSIVASGMDKEISQAPAVATSHAPHPGQKSPPPAPPPTSNAFFPHPQPQTLGRSAAVPTEGGAREMQRRLSQVLEQAQPADTIAPPPGVVDLDDQIAVAKQSWAAPGDVMIDEGYQAMPEQHANRAAAYAGGNQRPHRLPTHSEQQQFRPQPPAEFPRDAARMASNSPSHDNASKDHYERQQKQKKPGLIRRLTSMGR